MAWLGLEWFRLAQCLFSLIENRSLFFDQLVKPGSQLALGAWLCYCPVKGPNIVNLLLCTVTQVSITQLINKIKSYDLHNICKINFRQLVMRGTTKGEYNIPLQGSYRCHYGDPRSTCDSDAKSDKYSESARLYKLGKVSDFAYARAHPDFSTFLCIQCKVTIQGWDSMQQV